MTFYPGRHAEPESAQSAPRDMSDDWLNMTYTGLQTAHDVVHAASDDTNPITRELAKQLGSPDARRDGGNLMGGLARTVHALVGEVVETGGYVTHLDGRRVRVPGHVAAAALQAWRPVREMAAVPTPSSQAERPAYLTAPVTATTLKRSRRTGRLAWAAA